MVLAKDQKKINRLGAIRAFKKSRVDVVVVLVGVPVDVATGLLLFARTASADASWMQPKLTCRLMCAWVVSPFRGTHAPPTHRLGPFPSVGLAVRVRCVRMFNLLLLRRPP